jgi:predicted Abi (CAAX) family protease
LYDILLLLVAVAGITRYKALNTPFKILAIGAAVSLILNISENIFILKYKSNAPLFHIEAVSGYAFYAFIYYYLFTNKKLKQAIIISVIIVTLFAVFNALFWQPFYKVFPTHVNLPTLGLLVLFSLLLFRQMLLFPLKTPLLKQGVFWYNTAIIFYSTTMFLNIGLSNVYIRNASLDYLVFYLWYFIVYIFAILIGVTLLTDSKETNKTHAL